MSASDINITEQQYSIVKQPYRELYCRVDLLNYQFQVVDEIGGVVISDSWTISATSDIRRTGTLVIVPDGSDAYKIQAGSKIFLDKYVQVYIGMKDNRTDEIIYNNMGIYLINNPTHTFDSTTNQISLQLIDLMAKLTGLRNGYLEGYEYQLKEGQSVRDIIIALLTRAGFNNYSIEIAEEDYQTIQFDMSIDGTGTIYDILKTINENQYTNYQMYFDVNGVFHFKRIPMDTTVDTIMVNDDIWKYTYISHDVTTDYESLKNDIIVLGKTQTAAQYASSCTFDGARTFTITCSTIRSERNHIKLAFTTPSTMSPTAANDQYYINLNSYGSYPLMTSLGYTNFVLNPNTYYVVKFHNDVANPYWQFMGENQPYARVQEMNPNSPFYINGSVGDIRIVLSGGDYDNISTADLAFQRAKYELYTRCKLNDSLTLTCLPIYWLDVNWLVEITLPTESEPKLFIVKEISISNGVTATQTINLMSFYNFGQVNPFNSSTISLYHSNYITLDSSHVDSSGTMDMTCTVQAVPGYEGLNIQLDNLIANTMYELDFDFQFINPSFYNEFIRGFKVTNNPNTNYADTSGWQNNLDATGDIQSKKYTFLSTGTTAYFSLTLSDLVDGTSYEIDISNFRLKLLN